MALKFHPQPNVWLEEASEYAGQYWVRVKCDECPMTGEAKTSLGEAMTEMLNHSHQHQFPASSSAASPPETESPK